MFLFKLLGGIPGTIIAILLVVVGIWGWNQKSDKEAAVRGQEVALAQKQEAETARDTAINAARENENTIKRLEEEKENINTALNTLSTARVNNRVTAQTREVIIQREATVPENAAPAAPILGNIISEVQADRYRRRGITPPSIPAVPAEDLRQ